MFGRWLGVSHRVGNLMSYWVLTVHGRVISRTTVQCATNLELSTTEVKQRCQEFDERIKELLKDDNHVIQDGNERQLQDWDDYTEDNDADFANGNETETPAALTYSSVVSRDSVRIALLAASLNELEVLACDIQNAYLTADCREKIYIIAGPEFGSEEGNIMVIRKALYGLKSSGAAFRAHLAETLYDLSYLPIRRQTLMCGFDRRSSRTVSNIMR